MKVTIRYEYDPMASAQNPFWAIVVGTGFSKSAQSFTEARRKMIEALATMNSQQPETVPPPEEVEI